VVFELFQDLDSFSLDDYKPLADIDKSKTRIINFLRASVDNKGGIFRQIDDLRFELTFDPHIEPVISILDRDLAQNDDSLTLIGIDHPIINKLIEQWREADPATLGATASMNLEQTTVLSIWLVHSFGTGADTGTYLIPLAVDHEGKRVPSIEKQYLDCFQASPGQSILDHPTRQHLLHEHIEPTLQHELGYRGIASPERGYSTELLTWVEIE
jgi:hypothetical protein